MDTIRNVIKMLDPSIIEKLYFTKYPIGIHDIEDEDMTIAEYKQKVSEGFQECLKQLCESNSAGDPSVTKRGPEILFAYRAPFEGGTDVMNESIDIATVFMDDLKIEDKDNVDIYSCDLMDPADMMDCLIADIPYTMENLANTIVTFLHKTLFFDATEEELEAINAFESLKDIIEEAAKDPEFANTLEEHLDKHVTEIDLSEDSGIRLQYSETDEDREMFSMLCDAKERYSEYYQTRELQILKEKILSDTKQKEIDHKKDTER